MSPLLKLEGVINVSKCSTSLFEYLEPLEHLDNRDNLCFEPPITFYSFIEGHLKMELDYDLNPILLQNTLIFDLRTLLYLTFPLLMPEIGFVNSSSSIFLMTFFYK